MCSIKGIPHRIRILINIKTEEIHMSKRFHLILLSTAFFIPSLSANKGRASFRLGQYFVTKPQQIGPRRPAQEARENHTGIISEQAVRNAAIEILSCMNAESHTPRKIRTFPLCSPTNRENPVPPQSFEIYKSQLGNFAHFIATVTVKESLHGENRTRERVIVFYDNDGAKMVMETANKLAAECARILDVNISWQLVQYDDLSDENETLDNLD